MKNNVITVVVTYNRKELLRKGLSCLMSQTHPCDVLVVDNASTDGTKEMIDVEFNRNEVIYMNTGSNLGGSGGNQLGIKKAVLMGYEYIWIMDDDTWPEKDALEQLFKADKKLSGNWGFLSSVAYWTDGSICKMNWQKKDIFRHVKEKDYRHSIVKVHMATFVSLLVKAEVVKQVGLPIGEYFIWTDDWEFTGRISRAGYQGFMVTDSKVVHAMKQNMRVNFALEADKDRIERFHYIYRNDVNCYRQYGLIGWLYLISKMSYTTISILLKSRDDKFKKVKIMLQGFHEGFFFEPKIIR